MEAFRLLWVKIRKRREGCSIILQGKRAFSGFVWLTKLKMALQSPKRAFFKFDLQLRTLFYGRTDPQTRVGVSLHGESHSQGKVCLISSPSAVKSNHTCTAYCSNCIWWLILLIYCSWYIYILWWWLFLVLWCIMRSIVVIMILLHEPCILFMLCLAEGPWIEP